MKKPSWDSLKMTTLEERGKSPYKAAIKFSLTVSLKPKDVHYLTCVVMTSA